MEGFYKKHLYSILCALAFMFIAKTTFAQVNDMAFITIYKTILSPKCGVPACHDGSFEPNFTTLASSYNTLVNQPIVKNNIQGTFQYRVEPKNVIASELYERVNNCCFVNTNDEMPLMGNKLTKEELQKIANWIDEGAKHPNGSIISRVQ